MCYAVLNRSTSSSSLPSCGTGMRFRRTTGTNGYLRAFVSQAEKGAPSE